jgi:hypothetical protein
MRGFPFYKFINFVIRDAAELPGGNGTILGMEFNWNPKMKTKAVIA